MKLNKIDKNIAESMHDAEYDINVVICMLEVMKDCCEYQALGNLQICLGLAIEKLEKLDEKISLMYKFN